MKSKVDHIKSPRDHRNNYAILTSTAPHITSLSGILLHANIFHERVTIFISDFANVWFLGLSIKFIDPIYRTSNYMQGWGPGRKS